jgi:ribosome-associated protein
MKENTSIKEQILNPEHSLKAAPINTRAELSRSDAESCEQALDERICTALRAASDKKAGDLVVLDLRDVATFTDYFLITSGTNVRQVQAIADEVVARLKTHDTRAARVEGYKSAEWVLVDYGDFIVHVFEERRDGFMTWRGYGVKQNPLPCRLT